MSKLGLLKKGWDLFKGVGGKFGGKAAGVTAFGAAAVGGLGISKGLIDQTENESDKANATRQIITTAHENSLTQLDQSLLGHQSFIQQWEGSFWAPLLQPLFDTFLKAFGKETITERLEKAHNVIDGADSKREGIINDMESDTLDQGNDLILKQAMDKMGLGWLVPSPTNTTNSLDNQANVTSTFDEARQNSTNTNTIGARMAQGFEVAEQQLGLQAAPEYNPAGA